MNEQFQTCRPCRLHHRAELPGAVASTCHCGNGIVIAESNRSSITITVQELVADNPADAEIARNITEVVVANLRRGGSFVFIDWWRGDVRPQALITGRVARQDDTRLVVEVRLWDVASNQQLSGQRFQPEPDAPSIARLIVDHITERVTGRRNP